MFKVIQIGDQEVPMLCMASVDVYYKRIFGVDPLSALTSGDEGESTALMRGLGFIMAKYAESKDRKAMARLTEDDFLDWLDLFEEGDMLEALGEISDLYRAQKKPTSQEKKEADQ